jgi:hypothetical protein
MPIFNIEKILTATGILFTVLGLATSLPVFVKADLLITPKNSSQEKPLVFKAKPGDIINTSIDITNTSKDDASFDLQANDIVVTEDGSITLLQDKEQDKYLASWMKLLTGDIVVSSNAKINIPIQITIPSDILSKEYGAAVSVTTASSSLSNDTIRNTVRKGLKVYVFVGEDSQPTVSSKINSLDILDIESSNRENLQKKLNFWDKNNIVFSFKAEDTGNTFSVLNGKYTVTCEDGGEKISSFTTNLAPGVGEKEYYISTNIPYKSGKTSIKLDYTVEALNKSELGDLKSENISGSLSDETNSNQKSITQFRGIEKVQIDSYSVDKKTKIIKNLVVILFAIISFVVLKRVTKK